MNNPFIRTIKTYYRKVASLNILSNANIVLLTFSIFLKEQKAGKTHDHFPINFYDHFSYYYFSEAATRGIL